MAICFAHVYEECLKKADIIPLELNGEEDNEDHEIEAEVSQVISGLDLSLAQDELSEFLRIYDDSSEAFADAMLEDVDQLLQRMKISKENQEDQNEDDNGTGQVQDGVKP